MHTESRAAPRRSGSKPPVSLVPRAPSTTIETRAPPRPRQRVGKGNGPPRRGRLLGLLPFTPLDAPRRGGARALQLYCTCCTSCSDLDPNAPHSRRGPACKLITLTTAKHLYGCTAVVQLSTAFFLYNRLQIRTVIFSRAADRVSDPYSYSDALDCTCCTSCSDAHTGPCVPGMAGAVRCSGRPPEFTC